MDQQGSKVNTIGPEMIGMFNPLLDELDKDASIKAVVMISRKKDFIAGADIEAFAKVKQPGDWQSIGQAGHAILARMEHSRKPIVAAIHGACMGAGLEIALACTARVAADEGTVLALPEVKLGLLPGGGGTQRLTRLVGIQKSLDMMLTGKNIYPYPAKKMGLVDRLATPPALLNAALHLAKELIERPIQRADKRPMLARLLEGNGLTRGIIFKKAKEMVDRQTKGNYPAPYEIIECVRIGAEQGAQAGYAEEVRRFEKLILTPESFNCGDLLAMTDKKKNPLKDLVRPVDTIGMLGGFMGAGIAEVAAKNIRVLLKDIKRTRLPRQADGLEHGGQEGQAEGHVPVGCGPADESHRRPVDYAHFEQAQLVIEAVFEDLTIKHRVLAECEGHLNDQAIFASNTSRCPSRR